MSYVSTRRFPSSTTLDAEGQIGYVYKLAMSSDNRSLAIATQDMSLRLVDVETMQMSCQIKPAHDSTITDIKAVPLEVGGSGSIFISSSNDGTCKVWDLRQQVPIITTKLSPNTFDAPVYAAAVSRNGTCAASCGTNISLFKFGVWRKYFEYTESHFDTVSCLDLDNQILVSGGEDGLINIYNTEDLVNEDNGQCPIMTLNVGESVRSFCIGNGRLYSMSTTESLSVWDPNTGTKVCPDIDSIRSHPLIASEENGWGYLIGMNRECSRLLAGNSQGTLVEFDCCSNFSPICTFSTKHTGVIRSSVYLPDETLLTAGEDGYIYEWKLGTETVYQTEGKMRANRFSNSNSRPY